MPDQKTLHEFEFDTFTVDRRGTVIAAERFATQQRTERLSGDIVLELVAIPAGAYLMGSPERQGFDDEHPQHRVAVASLLVGRFPVTQEQWLAVMGAAPRCRFAGPGRPVDNVSWDAALEFCGQLAKATGRDYRLPSEAEWEYACRAGSTAPFAFGYTLTSELANYNGEFTYAAEPKGVYRHVTTEAGAFPPNAFGIHDMHGNLWEWCADPWHESYRGAPADGRVWETEGHPSLRVLRGGSWHDTPDVCRSAVRLKLPRGEGDDICGFRVALA
jgi:formylglycine-generating enzyme required for sulfatase activity